jgi:hypothetical protein
MTATHTETPVISSAFGGSDIDGSVWLKVNLAIENDGPYR